MTLRLDEETSQQLQRLSAATGCSQQKLVHEAVRQFLDSSAEAVRERRRQWQRALKIGRVCHPTQPVAGIPWCDAENPPKPDQAAEARWQEMIDAGYVQQAKGPLQHPSMLIPSPPGGILSYLDREDRF